MASRSAALLQFCLVVLVAIQSISAWSGTVTFYKNQGNNASAGTYTYHIDQSQECVNLSCYNDRAISAKWSNIVKWGAFDGKSRIAFYADKDCTGTVRDWDIDNSKGFPSNFLLDGLYYNGISSFMIWQYDKKAVTTTLPCPWDFQCCLQ